MSEPIILSKSLIRNNGGFYSLYFFLLNHYIFCQKNNIKLWIDTSPSWNFFSYSGLSDYFLQNEKIIEYKENSLEIKFDNIFESLSYESSFTIYDYRRAINEIYILHPKIDERFKNMQNEYQLLSGTYSSIFIRRGDKLVYESSYISTEEYFLLLLKLDPQVERIYLQTDDYTSFLELEELCKKYNKEYIRLYTICKENQRGMIVTSTYKNIMLAHSDKLDNFTPEYINSVTPVDLMSPEDKYKHVEDMLIGIELVSSSKICVTDYQSNVSRFIKLRHSSFHQVYDVQHQEIDENKVCMPAFSF